MINAIGDRRALPIVLCLLVLGASIAPAEDRDLVVYDSQSIAAYEERTARATQVSMAVLAGWSATNLALGTTLWLTSDDPVQAAFHQMNAGWNIVNAALALPALFGATRDLAAIPSGRTVGEIRAAQNRLEDAFLFNAGIDVGYMMAGVYMIERSRREEPNAATLEGFGRSLILQGGFLFAFDLVAYLVQRRIAPDS